jgi:MFS family permease
VGLPAVVSLRSAPPEVRRLTTFLGLIFAAGVLGGPVSSLLAVYVDSTLHQPPTFTSTLLALQLALTGLFALLGGSVADGLGQKRAVILGAFGLPLAATIFLLGDFWILAIVVVGLGITNSLNSVGGQAYLLASADAKRLGGFTAYYYLGSTFGGALGNLIFGPAAGHFGFRTAGLVELILGAALLVGFVRVLPDAPARPRAPIASPGVLLRSYADLLRRRRVALVGSMRFLPTSFYGTTSLLIPLLVYRLSHSVAAAAFYSTAMLLIASGTQMAVGRVIDRRGPAGPARVLTALLPLFALGLALSVRTLPALVVLGIGATSALWGMSTVIPSLVRDAVETPVQGRTLGLVHLLWSSGMLVGTLLAGALVEVNPALPFALFALATVPAFLAALAFRGDK